MADMTEFADLYAEWRSRPFPQGSTDDAVDELHAGLALVDAWVAEAVVPFVETGTVEPSRVDVLQELRNLVRTSDGLVQTGHDVGVASAHREYATLLLSVYEAFLAAANR